MSKQVMKPTSRGVDVIIYINDTPTGGQKTATLNRSMSPITITNQIKGEWAESLAGVKSWSLTCNGMFIKDEECFNMLEEAFYNNATIDIKMTDGNRGYKGKALITNFPVSAPYNDAFTYSLKFIGTGPIDKE